MKNRLRELRLARGWSQWKVAVDLNLSQNSVSRYEKGAHELSYELLIRFADYYRVSVDYILGRTDRPEVNR